LLPTIRKPRATDGVGVSALIGATPALDDNSLYCNLLQCTHFADTCALAERDGEIAGWMSGYVPPDDPETLFVWQVCVGEAGRGQGLAGRLIGAVLSRPHCAHIRQLACTITPDNAASWALFGSIARKLGAPLHHAPQFSRDAHFGGRHDSELSVTIGPFDRHRAQDLAAA
jgi:L-2,4-diaminobutyric acid acetyltransferase